VVQLVVDVLVPDACSENPTDASAFAKMMPAEADALVDTVMPAVKLVVDEIVRDALPPGPNVAYPNPCVSKIVLLDDVIVYLTVPALQMIGRASAAGANDR
jgi:hypothetical protein